MTKYVLAIMMAMGTMACGPHYEYFRGQDGSTGPEGEKGDQGERGDDGIDGTSVTVVKLCPGVTVYPSKFVEVAFCIGSKLYATYSANGGFTTEIPPGTYGSNGINASCNFVVKPNCQIQN